ncbi:hypothetical protein GCM10028801_31440 [Nocardioides maradonensis]
MSSRDERFAYSATVNEEAFLPYLTRGESSESCLDMGWNCSIDPETGRCTECGKKEDFNE